MGWGRAPTGGGGGGGGEAPRIYRQHAKVVRLSALRTGRLYPPGDVPGTHFYQRMCDSRPVVRSEGMRNH